MTSPLTDRDILITGGTGSFGRAFARRALDDGAERVAILSRSESKQAAMRAEFDDPRLRWLIGDVRDYGRMLDACRGVEIVIHAAAQKRVDTCDSERAEARATNVTGSENVARACIERGVESAVFLSTDKAANPSTFYGATKLLAEGLWIGLNARAAGTVTKLAVTRYGNVIGSTGSVVPKWRAEIAAGRRPTLTDAGMSRFLMTMDAAVGLVVLALSDMRSGAIYVPKIKAASMMDLLRAVDPDGSSNIVGVTGMQPGEKLREILITEEEFRQTYDCGTHYLVEPQSRTWGDEPPVNGRKVPADFSYRSDAVATLTVVELAEMLP